MPRYRVIEDEKALGHYRVQDTHTGGTISPAKSYKDCDRICEDLNKPYSHETRGFGKTEIIAIVLLILCITASAFTGWDDSKTYALNHGTESFE